MPQTTKRETKKELIINSTIALLKAEGYNGLSMRKVAERSQMTLSNLQYYFKTMEDLLKATIASYFKQCEKAVVSTFPFGRYKSYDLKYILRDILGTHLNSDSANEMYAVLREVWSISSHNQEVHKIMMNYYSGYSRWLTKKLSAYTSNPEAIAALLLPYLEGYSLVGNALNVHKDKIVDAIVESAVHLHNKGK